MTYEEYVNEHQFFDAVLESTHNANVVSTCAYYEWADEIRQAEQRYLFESVSIDALYEAANDGFFAKIGKVVMDLMDKVNKFFGDLLDKLKQITGIGKTESEKASAFIRNNPQYSDKIIAALEEGRVTINDVASFEKDATSLIELIQSQKIDEDSFKQKFKKSLDKFQSSSEVLLKTAGTVVSIITIIPKLTTACTDAKKSLDKTKGALNSFKSKLGSSKLSPSNAKLVISSLTQLINVQTAEFKKRMSLLTRFVKGLVKFNRS